jgi:hypothetical protein
MGFLYFILLFFGIFWVLIYINTTIADIASAKLGGSTQADVTKAARLRLLALTLAALNWAIFICLRL